MPQENESQEYAGHHRIDAISDEFEAQFRAGSPPSIEDFLQRGGGNDRDQLLRALMAVELELRAFQKSVSP